MMKVTTTMKVSRVIHPQWLSVKLLERTKEEEEEE